MNLLISQEQSCGKAYFIRAYVNFKKNHEIDENIDDLYTAEKFGEKSVEFYLFLLKLLILCEQTEKITEISEKIEKLLENQYENLAELFYKFAKCLLKINLSKSLFFVNKSISMKPMEKAYLLRAVLNSNLENPLKSLEDFNMAKPENYKEIHYFEKSKCLLKLEKYEEILKNLNEGIEKYPNSYNLINERAYFSINLKNLVRY